MSLICFASFSDRLVPLLGKSLTGGVVTEFLVIGGAVLLVTGGVVVWVLVFRRSRKRTRIYRHHHHDSAGAAVSDSLAEAHPNGRRRRQRRPRPRNPTLAETGGLPPVRQPVTPPPDCPS